MHKLLDFSSLKQIVFAYILLPGKLDSDVVIILKVQLIKKHAYLKREKVLLPLRIYCQYENELASDKIISCGSLNFTLYGALTASAHEYM